MNIEFDNDSEVQGGWTWHYGTLTRDGKEFPFSVLKMDTNVGGMNVDPSFEITWIEDEPTEKQTAEKSVLEHFRLTKSF